MIDDKSPPPGRPGIHAGQRTPIPRARSSRRPGFVFLALLFVIGYACGDAVTPGSDESLAFLVGSWRAETFVVTNAADEGQSVDLVETGSTFLFQVEPSGRYQASLTIVGATSTVFGRLELSGEQITLFQDFPTQDTQVGTLEQLAPDRVRLTAETGFDFDQDGALDPATFSAGLLRDDD